MKKTILRAGSLSLLFTKYCLRNQTNNEIPGVYSMNGEMKYAQLLFGKLEQKTVWNTQAYIWVENNKSYIQGKGWQI
jgi:hypothetical protein